MDYTLQNPWFGVQQGQNVYEGLTKAHKAGREEADEIAAREAAALMGGGDYFTGYEGTPGATRPDYLKRLFASGNPDVALKMEGLLAAPYAMQREIKKAGEIEGAKKAADYKAGMNALAQYVKERQGKVPAAVAGAVPVSTEEEIPSAPMVGEPGARQTSMAPQPNMSPRLEDLPGDEESVEFTPQGLKFGVKSMSPFEKGVKGEERRIAAATEKRQAVQQAHENVRKVGEEIVAVQTKMQNREIPWEVGKQQVASLQQDLAAAIQYRDRILTGGKPVAAPAPAPAAVAPAAPPAAAASAGGPPQFTEKEEAALANKNRGEKVTAANKEIEDARKDVINLAQFSKPIEEMYNIVTKNKVGHPALAAGGEWAASALSFDKTNARVKNLNDQILNMYIKPGQSQLMNTIIEGMKRSASVPGVFTEPQQNKINAVVMRSQYESLKALPSFLEKWQKGHGGTLDGAAEAWVDYTDNNPAYKYKKDKRGDIMAYENSQAMPYDKWAAMKAAGKVRQVGHKTYIEVSKGVWKER